MKYDVIHVSYHRPKDVRILKPCLTEWFQNPKDLNLTSPKTRYPFSFNHWVQAYYQNSSIDTLVLRTNGWIVAHISILPYPDKKLGHLFHLFVDPSHRGMGNGKRLIHEAEKVILNHSFHQSRLYTNEKNVASINLFKSIGYHIDDNSSSDRIEFLKELSKPKP